MNIDELRQLLQTYCPGTPHEALHAQEIQTLLKQGINAWNRENYTPGHLTASSFIIDANAEKVALIFHSKLHRWLQPGGHVEASDKNILSAAQRELAEETGLSLNIIPSGNNNWSLLDLDIHTIPARPNQPEHKHFDLRFVLILPQGQHPILVGADDAVDAQWLPLESLLDSGEEGLQRCYKKLCAKSKKRSFTV
ncbi:MAG: NUDIX hydrolase [Akkermansia sp.]